MLHGNSRHHMMSSIPRYVRWGLTLAEVFDSKSEVSSHTISVCGVFKLPASDLKPERGTTEAGEHPLNL